MTLKVIKAKPNPAGKDKIGSLYIQQQLAGEWVDVQNTGQQNEPLGNVELYHCAYKLNDHDWKIVSGFTGSLPPGKIMRVHAGHKIPLDQMNQVDVIGADYHIFSNQGYVWNNSRKDYPRLYNKQSKAWIDKTYYDAFPPEGKILNRISDKLV